MAYWLLKSESDEWSWAEHVANGRDGAEWTGIRNHTAQKYLRAMKKGERAFFYHTGKERGIVGIVEVIAEAHLTPAGHAPTEAVPTAFGLDPTGSFLFAAGTASGRLASYRVNGGTGR